VEAVTHLQNFFDSDRVTCLLDSNDIPINYQVTEGVREEEKQTYFVLYSCIMRLRQFHAEVEKGVS